MAVRIGELLLKEKRITPEQLQEALNYQRQNGGKLGYNLIKLGYVKDEEITALLSKQYGVPSIALTQFEIDPVVLKLVPAETAAKYQIGAPALSARRRYADDRHDGVPPSVRHGRSEVHDGLQRPSRGRLGNRPSWRRSRMDYGKVRRPAASGQRQRRAGGAEAREVGARRHSTDRGSRSETSRSSRDQRNQRPRRPPR
jgi:hypothetical protein